MNLQEIGQKLKEARLQSGQSQEQIASSIGMSRATVSALESGRCKEIGARKLAALLGQVGLDLLVAPRRSRPTLDDIRLERRGEKVSA
ncbi:MAG: helix-turn-helix transcriptional regulator [Steroidobacteraceae bacterium]